MLLDDYATEECSVAATAKWDQMVESIDKIFGLHALFNRLQTITGSLFMLILVVSALSW